MMTLPDINELIKDLNGELFPFNFIKLLWRLRKPRTRRVARAADGRRKKLHETRLASQLAFMMIEYIRRAGVGNYGVDARRGRLDPRGQQGDAVDRRAARRRGQSPLPDLRKSAVTGPPNRKTQQLQRPYACERFAPEVAKVMPSTRARARARESCRRVTGQIASIAPDRRRNRTCPQIETQRLQQAYAREGGAVPDLSGS